MSSLCEHASASSRHSAHALGTPAQTPPRTFSFHPLAFAGRARPTVWLVESAPPYADCHSALREPTLHWMGTSATASLARSICRCLQGYATTSGPTSGRTSGSTSGIHLHLLSGYLCTRGQVATVLAGIAWGVHDACDAGAAACFAWWRLARVRVHT